VENQPPQRTEEEELQLLDAIRTFSESVRGALKQVPPPPSDERHGVSGASSRFLLDESLSWVKRFLVEKNKEAPLIPREAGDQAQGLWLFSSYMAYHQGLTVLDADFDALFEFFFWWYPRHWEKANEEFTQRLFATLDELYAWLTARGTIPSDQFMHDFLTVEEKALQLLALYQQLDHNSPYFEEQFDALFGLEPPEA
jgi:hypothetical protein